MHCFSHKNCIITTCLAQHMAHRNATCYSECPIHIENVLLQTINWTTSKYYETNTNLSFSLQTNCSDLNRINPVFVDMYNHRLPVRFEERAKNSICDDTIEEDVIALAPMDLWNPYEGSHQLIEMYQTLLDRNLSKTRLLWLRDPYCKRQPTSALQTDTRLG